MPAETHLSRRAAHISCQCKLIALQNTECKLQIPFCIFWRQSHPHKLRHSLETVFRLLQVIVHSLSTKMYHAILGRAINMMSKFLHFVIRCTRSHTNIAHCSVIRVGFASSKVSTLGDFVKVLSAPLAAVNHSPIQSTLK